MPDLMLRSARRELISHHRIEGERSVDRGSRYAFWACFGLFCIFVAAISAAGCSTVPELYHLRSSIEVSTALPLDLSGTDEWFVWLNDALLSAITQQTYDQRLWWR